MVRSNKLRCPFRSPLRVGFLVPIYRGGVGGGQARGEVPFTHNETIAWVLRRRGCFLRGINFAALFIREFLQNLLRVLPTDFAVVLV